MNCIYIIIITIENFLVSTNSKLQIIINIYNVEHNEILLRFIFYNLFLKQKKNIFIKVIHLIV